MVTDQICNNCLWLLTILYLLNYTAEVLGISLAVVFHQTSSYKIVIRRRDSHLFVASHQFYHKGITLSVLLVYNLIEHAALVLERQK